MVNNICDATIQQFWLPSSGILIGSQKEDWTTLYKKNTLSFTTATRAVPEKAQHQTQKVTVTGVWLFHWISRKGLTRGISWTLIPTRGKSIKSITAESRTLFATLSLLERSAGFPRRYIEYPPMEPGDTYWESLTRIAKHNCTSVPITAQRIHSIQKSLRPLKWQRDALFWYLWSSRIAGLVGFVVSL